MIGTLIGLGTGLLGNIIGGIQSSNAMEQYKKQLEAERRSNLDWYNRRYNEDYTQTAEAQHMLNKASELAKQQMAAALGRQAVMGGTEESVAAQRAQANDLVSDTMGNIAAQGTARKDKIEEQYLNRKDKINEQFKNLYTTQANNSASAGSAAMQAGMGLVGLDLQSKLATGKGLFGDVFNRKKNNSLINSTLGYNDLLMA